MLRLAMRLALSLVVACFVLACFAGCGPRLREEGAPDFRREPETEPEREPREAELPRTEELTGATADLEMPEEPEAVFADIHFEFDRHDLDAAARQILNQIAFVMFDNPDLLIIIEGHCDERGSNEYNLALGERRAEAARDYLIEMGIEPHRISTISYGEERPLVKGHDEAAWAANRRAHFVIVGE